MEQNTEKFSILNSQFSILTSYFPDLTDRQKEQYAALYDLYTDWNAKINVISRKDIENLYPHHVLHSLGITDMLRFKPGSSVMDLGTGGGFPGIPLAILFPETHFHLVDSIGKKIKVGQAVADRAGEHILPPLPGRGGKAAFRFRGKPCRDASGGSGKARPQEYKERTDQRVAQRIDLPERWRAGARDIAFPEPSDKHGSERPF